MSADPAHDPSAARCRSLCGGVVGTVLGMALFLAGVMFVVGRPDWWRGYTAATVAIVLAAGASLVPLAWGIRRGAGMLVQMFMASTAIRAAVALGVAALAVGVGGYPAVPTFMLLVPYYLVLLAVETACLARSMRPGS